MNEAQDPKGRGVPGRQATPNRDRRRTPPLIEGEAEILTPQTPVEPAQETAAAPAEETAKETAEISKEIAESAGESAAGKPEEASADGRPPEPNADAKPESKEDFEAAAADAPDKGAHDRKGLPIVAGAAAAAVLVAGAAFFAFLPGDNGGAVVDPQTSAANAGNLAALGSRIDALERDAKAAETRNSAALASLRQQLTQQLTKELSGKELAARELVAKELASAEAALARRVQALESALADSGRTTVGDAPKTQSRVNAEPPEPKIDLAPLEARLAQLENRLKPVEDRVEPLPGALTDLRAALTADGASAKTGADKAQAAAQAAALVVVAQSISAAVEAGKPYGPALETLLALKAPAASIEALRPTLEGAPSLPDLVAGFAKIETALIAKPARAEGGSLFERLSQSASALVRVRPAGDGASGAESGSSADHAARIERALARGDAAAALAQWERMSERMSEQLPESAKAASAQWAKALRARTSAQEAARVLLSDAMARLARS